MKSEQKGIAVADHRLRSVQTASYVSDHVVHVDETKPVEVALERDVTLPAMERAGSRESDQIVSSSLVETRRYGRKTAVVRSMPKSAGRKLEH